MAKKKSSPIKQAKRIDIGQDIEAYEDDIAFAAKGQNLLKEGETLNEWNDIRSLETASKTHLEDDDGTGQAIIIRRFEFKLNSDQLTSFVLATGSYPTKQDLFNSVLKGIEITLWKDGLKVFPDQDPRVIVDDHYTKFEVFVASIPQKGQRILETPQTLSQIVHGR